MILITCYLVAEPMLSEELIQKVISGNALLYFSFVISCCAGGRVSLFNYGSVLEKIFFFHWANF
jgi:hypothetical protein